MAKIHEPNYLKWRSSHGAITGAVSRMGAIARAHSAPRRRRNFDKITLTKRQCEIVAHWRSLTQSQRDDWDSFGLTFKAEDKYGEPYYRSGFDWFCSMSSRMLLYFGSLPADPPVSPTPDWTPTCYCYWDPLFLVVRIYVDSGPASDQKMLVNRQLNCPISVVSTPLPIPFYKTLSSVDFPVPAVASIGEMLPGEHEHHFILLPIDSWGRTPGPTYSSVLQ